MALLLLWNSASPSPELYICVLLEFKKSSDKCSIAKISIASRRSSVWLCPALFIMNAVPDELLWLLIELDIAIHAVLPCLR